MNQSNGSFPSFARSLESPPKARFSASATQKILRVCHHTRVEDRVLESAEFGVIAIRLYRPCGVSGALPVVIYYPETTGSDTHQRMLHEIALQARAAVIWVRTPNTLEAMYAVSCWVAEHGRQMQLDPERIALAGEGVGGHNAVTVALMAAQRGTPQIRCQLLLYPITETDFGLRSYREFTDGPWLTPTEMEWVWDQYQINPNVRTQSTLTPWHETPQALHALPVTLIVTANNSDLRDEGETYADRLLEAGVHVSVVRCLATSEEFARCSTEGAPRAVQVAFAQALEGLRAALKINGEP
jgi:acetyl esterase